MYIYILEHPPKALKSVHVQYFVSIEPRQSEEVWGECGCFIV